MVDDPLAPVFVGFEARPPVSPSNIERRDPLPESPLKRLLQQQAACRPELPRLRTPRTPLQRSASLELHRTTAAAAHSSSCSDVTFLSRSSEPISIPLNRLHPLSPAAQIMEEVVSPCMGTPLTFCEAEQSRPQTFSLHRPAAVLREVEVHLEESQDAALHLVQALRFELEQRFDVQEECRAYGEHCDSELCFDMDMPKPCCCPSQERSRTMLSVA